MYWSARLSVCRPLATGRYRQNRPSTIDFGCRRSIEGEIDGRRSIKGEKGKKKKRKRRKKKEERRGERRKNTSHRRRSRVTHELSPPSWAIFLLRREKD
ncbi:hypothetical protein B296_00058330 [Ensete ventricosum]|uniref:Uncharacterized protein n=1 Tax=Ensete ventricosum TaxID=4639 RepID=A0A426XMQ3_ENSVE|nr:hypothetical protein B296_00058330 [Ensete ventricosum]